MKYVVTIISVIGISVAFLYFLFNNPSFLPENSIGEINWLNVGVFLFLLSTVVFCLISLIVFGMATFLKKGSSRRSRIFISFKIAILFTLGLLLIFLLNFFHVLDWIWGLSILLVVLIASFVI